MQLKTSPDTAAADTIFYFAPEIEQSLVALLWQHPELFELAKRELDFDIHIISPPLRRVLQALELVIGEPGIGIDADWATVVSAIRELGALDEVGGLPGLNQIFTDSDRYPYGKGDFHEGALPFAHYYIDCLKTYAANRQSEPALQRPLFVGGRGYLRLNKAKKNEQSPDYLGQANIQGVHFTVLAWKQSDGSISFNLRPEHSKP